MRKKKKERERERERETYVIDKLAAFKRVSCCGLDLLLFVFHEAECLQEQKPRETVNLKFELFNRRFFVSNNRMDVHKGVSPCEYVDTDRKLCS